MAQVTIEKFWAQSGRELGKKGRELSQFLTEELLILGIV
jgi:hypothetical protein